MAVCKNCFIFDEFKLRSKIGFFETRQSMVVFILNAILNIEKYFLDFCKCDGENVCAVCDCAEMFKRTQFAVHKNSLNYDFVNKVRGNLYLKLSELIEDNNHFVCKIINEKYSYEE